MADNPFNDAWVRAYLATTGRTLAPGSMALEETPLAVRKLAPAQEGVPALSLHDIPETLPASTTEEALRTWIRKVALPHGWLHFHVHDSRRSAGEGFPDDLFCNGTDILVWELKMHGKKPSANQEKWLSLLAHTGKVECGVKYPHDWGNIVERLTRKTT